MVETISDVNVQISILNPAPRIGLGRPLIFVKGDALAYKEYANLDEIKADFAADTSVYAKAKAILLQNNKPDSLAVLTFEEGKIAQAAEEYFLKSWHFALLADFAPADALALSNLIEENKFKFLIVQVDDVSKLGPLNKNKRTIAAVHAAEGEHLDAAWLGDTANATVGSVTWKGRHDLVGITAQELKASEVIAIQNAGGTAYVAKGGIPQTSEGKTVSGEYIDALHGDDWVKSSIETNVQKLLTETDKLTFDARGIALLQGVVTTVLNEAFANGIVDMDDETNEGNYSVTVLQRSDLNPDDIARRNYKGLSFNYKRSGAIHTVDVYGQIEV